MNQHRLNSGGSRPETDMLALIDRYGWGRLTHMQRNLRLILLTGLLVCGCDPGVSVSSRTTVSQKVDVACIKAAISAASAKTFSTQSALQPSDPIDPNVTQIEYSPIAQPHDPAAEFSYMLRLTRRPDGGTDYSNGWQALGTAVPSEAADLVRRVDLSVQRSCDLPVATNLPNQGS
jgi:hypothetical protein